MAFFDLNGDDFLEVVELSRIDGCVSKSFSSTLLTLITKCDKPTSFSDFHLISIYNLIYKVISKVISNRIKPKMVKVLSKEEFGFLDNRQITKVVGIIHECLHSIKLKKMKELILKMDLIKAYDRVNWSYL